MKHLAHSLMIFLIIPFAHAESKCEGEAKRPALTPVEGYMVLVKQSLTLGELKPQHIEELTREENPTHPLREGRGIGNLSLRDGFRRVMRVLKPEHWPAVVNALNVELGLRTEEASQVEDAVERTRPLFTALPTMYQLPPETQILKSLVTRTGEIFVYATRLLDSYVHNVRAGTELKIERLIGRQYQGDLFETASGQIVFALIKDKVLTVYDAKTQVPLVSKELPARGDPLYAPYFYESEDSLKVVVGYAGSPLLDENSEAPLYTLDVKTKGLTQRMIKCGRNIRFTRLTNGHIYAIGTSIPISPDAKFGYEYAFAYDAVENKYIVNIYTDKVGELYGPVLLDGPTPQLIFTPFTNARSDNWFVAQPELDKVSRLRGPVRPTNREIIQLVDGSHWITYFVEDTQEQSADVSVIPLSPENKSAPLNHTLNGIANIRGVDHINRIGKDIFIVREVTQGPEIIHFYNRSFREIGTVHFPFPTISPPRPFVDPSDGRVYIFASADSNQPVVLYQIYGPEQLR